MDNSMHAAILLSAILAVTGSIVSAAAGETENADRGTAATSVAPHGVTRAHVRAELQAAKELGLVPLITYINYPYSEEQKIRLHARTAEIEAAQARSGGMSQ